MLGGHALVAPARRLQRAGVSLAGGSLHPPLPLLCSLLCYRFCWPCISRWAEIETTCPFCKARFSQLRHKQLAPGADAVARSNPNTELPGIYVDTLQALPERNQVRHPAAAGMRAVAGWRRRLLGTAGHAAGSCVLARRAAAAHSASLPFFFAVGLRLRLWPAPPQRVVYEDPNFQHWIDSVLCLVW